MNLQSSTSKASINFLTSAWLHKAPGMKSVAKAMVKYQEAMRHSASPTDTYKSDRWLKSLESTD